jgi:hypothetical protein
MSINTWFEKLVEPMKALKVSVRILLSLPVLMILFLTWTHAAPDSEQYVYIEKTGDRKKSFTWSLRPAADGVVIEALFEDGTFINTCDPSGRTREWMVVQSDERVRVVREENSLVFSGYLKGERIDRRVEIDACPWFQPLTYSLRKFLDSPQERITFWHIRSDTLEPVKLLALKSGKQGEICQGTRGHLVELRPVGLLAPLWRASYWFRSSDKVFCRYESRHGGWGTPLTIVSLQERE